jgi:lysozyme
VSGSGISLKTVEALAERLAQEEGLALHPYKDTVGKLTIGHGRNLSDRGITEDEAQYLLANDIQAAVQDLDRHLPWWTGLDPVRQIVIADMCFNLGINGLLQFHHTLAAVRHGHWTAAASGMRASRWYRQVGERAVRLAKMMETGEEVEIV